MKRIDTANRAADLFGPGKDGFQSGVPGILDPTRLSAGFMNGLQEAIVRTIERAGEVPSDDFDLFPNAIEALVQSGIAGGAIVADYVGLRAYNGSQKSVYVTGCVATSAPSGIAGMFILRADLTPATATDNGGTRIVGAHVWDRAYSGAVDPRWFGANNGGIIDTTAAFDAVRASGATAVDLAAGTYKINVFHSNPNMVYRGIGNPVVAFSFVSASAWLGFQSGSRYEGITFQSNEANLPNQRGAIESVSNVYLRNCALKGFRDAAAAPNAWGVQIANANNVILDNCEFATNSQSDIAITDNVQDVTIINARNSTDGGVLLNIEPNTSDGVNGLNIIGGHYRQVWLQEVDNRGYAGRNIVFDGARVDTLYYDGSGASFQRCDIAALKNAPDGAGNVYAGALMIDTCGLGPNLIPDPYLFDVSSSDANAAWAVYTSGAAPYYQRMNDTDGKYLRINPNKANGDFYPTSRVNIAVTAGETLLLFLRARCNNTSTTGTFTGVVFVQWKDAGGTTLSTTTVRTCRGAFASFTDWTNDIAILIPPANAVAAKVYVGATGAVSVDVASIGLFRPKLRRSGMGNMPEVIGRLSRPNQEREFMHTRAPAGAAQWPGYFVGERIINSNPTVGQPKAWTCTAAGTGGASGTWASEGNL